MGLPVVEVNVATRERERREPLRARKGRKPLPLQGLQQMHGDVSIRFYSVLQVGETPEVDIDVVGNATQLLMSLNMSPVSRYSKPSYTAAC